MYSACLSYNQIKEYLTILMDDGLVQHDLSSQKFRITKKGLNLLQRCEKLGDLIEEETPINPRSW